MEQFKLRIDIFNILKQPYLFQTTRLSRGLICNTSPYFLHCLPHSHFESVARLMGKIISNLAFVFRNDPLS